MSTDVSGMIECRPGARIWGEDDEDAIWHEAIDLFVLNTGNAYDALACLFGVRNSFGFRPPAEERGLPEDVSDRVRQRFHAGGWGEHNWGTTWVSWAELTALDWDETNLSGSLSRRAVAGEGTHWAPVWDVMRTLAGLHGPEHVRLVVWFY
ncbi:hypothetical protein [Streptomyces sp. KS_5]|uniref:hypothetical protein n=1 Tax=Streptomyces TaxID=1883 RepID=UPI00089B4288|nr:hypothetical protein [Streptomyces sp. KS_5]SED21700.1 hypothetical protein SAMN05428938_4260 [Streptomyces sp. KS_5]